MFIIGIVAAVVICVPLYYANAFDETLLMKVRIFGGLGMGLAFGLIGFIDDYIKVVKKRNLGLTVIQKLVLQFLAAAAYLAGIWLAGGKSSTLIPFVGEVDFGWGYWILAAILIVGIFCLHLCHDDCRCDQRFQRQHYGGGGSCRMHGIFSVELQSGQGVYGRYRFSVLGRYGLRTGIWREYADLAVAFGHHLYCGDPVGSPSGFLFQAHPRKETV